LRIRKRVLGRGGGDDRGAALLKQMNISLLVDDFGTGYSSLNSPAQLPHRHRQNRSVLRRPMRESAKIEEIVRAVINLRATLGRYLFSKPLDAGAIEALLAEGRVW
jgi:predicted signal transduction protein with EAL and GGDEF domain